MQVWCDWQVTLCDPHLSALEVKFSRRCAIQIDVYVYLTHTFTSLVPHCCITCLTPLYHLSYTLTSPVLHPYITCPTPLYHLSHSVASPDHLSPQSCCLCMFIMPLTSLSICRVPRPNLRTERPLKPKIGWITPVTHDPILR